MLRFYTKQLSFLDVYSVVPRYKSSTYISRSYRNSSFDNSRRIYSTLDNYSKNELSRDDYISIPPLIYSRLDLKRFMSRVAANLQKAHQQMKGMERMNSSAQHPWERSLIMGWKRAEKTKKKEGVHRQIP